jgi:predicted ATP-grasp superfamily ATP-dependent carboligase
MNNSNPTDYFLKPSKEGLIKKYFHIDGEKSLNNALDYFYNIGYSNEELILQEFINGIGIGYFAICEDGLPVVEYAHERIREWPINGGYSTACKRHQDSNLFSMSRMIIQQLNWRGPIMIEYRKNLTNGKYYFIEANPKFWGSLELGFESGVDIAGATISIINKSHKLKKQSNLINSKLSIAWPLDGDSFHYLLSPKVFFNLFKTKTYISTGLLRDPMYGLIKLFYLPVRIIKELIK